jgi:nucleoside-diphosphate-sugar epimerase
MASPRVLLTGANGFIGSHILSYFLEKSIFVQAVVRSQEKANRVMKDFPTADRSKLDFSIVPDITAPGAFDKCMQETQPIDAVVHTASPFNYSTTKAAADFIEPAVHGTTEILKSTLKYAPGVKRFVITSSFAAIGNPLDLQGNGRLYSSEDWDPVTMEQGMDNLRLAYWASKTFAERSGQSTMLSKPCPFDRLTF